MVRLGTEPAHTAPGPTNVYAIMNAGGAFARPPAFIGMAFALFPGKWPLAFRYGAKAVFTKGLSGL